MPRSPSRVAVIGHFDDGVPAVDGQTVKTRVTRDLIRDVCGPENVIAVDTKGWSQRPLSLLFECVGAIRSTDVVVMLPAQNGLKVFGPLIGRVARRCGSRSVYSVIGGWLPDYLEKRPRLAYCLRDFDDVLVESRAMANRLMSDLSFDNVRVFNNFKCLPKVNFDDLPAPMSNPYRLIYFARVERRKGVEDAIWAVAEANRRKRGRYSLDIYGHMQEGYEEEFGSCIAEAGDPSIQYRGCVDCSESLGAFAGAIALLFPTRYPTEGIPGTIVDAFCSATPVIASRWQSWNEMICESENGLTYELGNRDALLSVLIRDDLPQCLMSMRASALKAADEYRYEAGLKAFSELFDCP